MLPYCGIGRKLTKVVEMSSLKVFQDFYESLMDLPMNDAKFIAKLYARRLLPDQVIELSVKNNDLTSFKTLLSIMEDGDDDVLKKLAQVFTGSSTIISW